MNPPSDSAVFYRSLTDRYPHIAKGQGTKLWDDSGHELIDLTSGISSTALIGQGRNEIVEAISDQVSRLSYIHSSGATHESQEQLARRLVALAPEGLTRAMFSSGGSEANEVALRIIRQYRLARGEQERRIVLALHPSYHGATAGALSLTGRWDISRDYEPYLFPVRHVPAPINFRGPYQGLEGDELARVAIEHMRGTIESVGPERVSAIVVEPVALSTAMAVPPREYWLMLRELCSEYEIVLMADEVITAMGRTGSFFRFESIGVSPDVVTLAKGLGAGYIPLGATLVSSTITETIGDNRRQMAEVHTHSGAPIPCAVGLAVLDVIDAEGLVERARSTGEILEKLLTEHIEPLPYVGEVRGVGLMYGVEYIADTQSREPFPTHRKVGAEITASMWRRGFLSRTMHHESSLVGDCTNFVPALTIDPADLEMGVLALRDTLIELEPAWREVSNG